MTRFPKLRLTAVAIIAIGVAVSARCAPASARMPGEVTAEAPARLKVKVAGRIQTVSLEEYVLGAALSEVTPVSEIDEVAARIYEVQSIVARTYATAQAGRHRLQGFDLCDTTHCQIYEPARVRTSRFSALARASVMRTAGRILRFDKRPALTLFHSDCGGHTTTPAASWGGLALPYLPASRDDVPGAVHRTWQFAATVAEWTKMVAADPRTNPGGRVRNLEVTGRDGSGRASEVEISGPRVRKVTGEMMRSIISAQRGARSVMSANFEIRRTSDGFLLEGTGFGHGVGLCQVGAIARARRGDSLEAILRHYYPGAR